VEVIIPKGRRETIPICGNLRVPSFLSSSGSVACLLGLLDFFGLIYGGMELEEATQYST
jgi:hypothetical protein